VVEAVVMVNVEEQVGVQLFGLKEAEAPEGNPEAERVIAEAGPTVVKVAVTVVEIEPPWPTVPEEGETERLKSAATVKL